LYYVRCSAKTGDVVSKYKKGSKTIYKRRGDVKSRDVCKK